jgi:uncharacterized protein YfiM (DUF2279 family)
MRKFTFLLLLLLSLNAFGQDRFTEKVQIFNNATVLTYAGGQVLHGFTGWKYSHEMAAVSVFSLGVVKEFYFDEGPSTKDITINLMGAITGYYLNKKLNQRFNKIYNKKKLKNKQVGCIIP